MEYVFTNGKWEIWYNSTANQALPTPDRTTEPFMGKVIIAYDKATGTLSVYDYDLGEWLVQGEPEPELNVVHAKFISIGSGSATAEIYVNAPGCDTYDKLIAFLTEQGATSSSETYEAIGTYDENYGYLAMVTGLYLNDGSLYITMTGSTWGSNHYIADETNPTNVDTYEMVAEPVITPYHKMVGTVSSYPNDLPYEIKVCLPDVTTAFTSKNDLVLYLRSKGYDYSSPLPVGGYIEGEESTTKVEGLIDYGMGNDIGIVKEGSSGTDIMSTLTDEIIS